MDVYNDTTGGAKPVGFVVFEYREVNNIASFDCNGNEWSRIVYIRTDGAPEIVYTNVWNFNQTVTGAGSNDVCSPATNRVYGNEITYCQPGDVVILEMGTHYTEYINYNGYYGFTLDQSGNATYTEDVIYSPAGITYSGSTNNQVPITNFAPSNYNYHVCTVVPTSDGLSATAAYQSSVQDLEVQGFTSGTKCFISFINENSGGQYALDGGDESLSVDCGLVATNAQCYAATPCSDDVDIMLEYQGGPSSNEIQIPKSYLSGL